jgi:very-short-patch-repair endonuclease
MVDIKTKEQKKKQTNLSRYGVEHVAQLDENKTKTQKTILKKYGKKHHLQNKHILAKQKTTNLAKYGVENVSQSKEIQEKISNTNIALYGTEKPAKSEIIKTKTKQYFMDTYGFENPFQSPEIKVKIKKKLLDKYGVEHHLQLQEYLDKQKATNLSKYGFEYAGQSPEAIRKTKQTNLDKYGTEYYFESQDFIDKSNANQWFTSKAELEIKQYIELLGLTVLKKRCDNKELDIVTEDKKIAIEYNGLYWHSEVHKDNNFHFEKTQTANKHGYRLIHVFEHEWENKKDQVKSYLRSALGMNTVRLFARKCKLVITEKDNQVLDFIDKHHIQGKAKSILEVSLYHDNQLVAVASFGRHHRDAGKIVLNRFVCLPDVTVVGGLSRISKAASLYFKQDIISWCDLRWSEGNGYLKAGWEQEAILKPDYFYTDFTKAYSKQSRKRDRAQTPVGLTEHEHALQDGLFRVYDCGKIRFIYKHNR